MWEKVWSSQTTFPKTSPPDTNERLDTTEMIAGTRSTQRNRRLGYSRREQHRINLLVVFADQRHDEIPGKIGLATRGTRFRLVCLDEQDFSELFRAGDFDHDPVFDAASLRRQGRIQERQARNEHDSELHGLRPLGIFVEPQCSGASMELSTDLRSDCRPVVGPAVREQKRMIPRRSPGTSAAEVSRREAFIAD